MAVRLCLRKLAQRVISPNTSTSTLNSFSYNPAAIISNSTSNDLGILPSLYFACHFSSSSQEGNIHSEDSEKEKKAAPSNLKGCSEEEKKSGAASIGYNVLGPLQPSDRVFKPYIPVFAVLELGSHQFKVSNGDSIFVERLKFCEVNDKIVLNKVLLLGSATQTIVGRPTIPDAAVYAVVEEHAMDAKVIIFKKKRRKNYRRTKGHRQELTQLKITDIIGIAKPKLVTPITRKSTPDHHQEKVAVSV